MSARKPLTAHEVEAAADARALLQEPPAAPVAEVLGAVHRGLAAVASEQGTVTHSPLGPAGPTQLAVRRRTGF